VNGPKLLKSLHPTLQPERLSDLLLAATLPSPPSYLQANKKLFYIFSVLSSRVSPLGAICKFSKNGVFGRPSSWLAVGTSCTEWYDGWDMLLITSPLHPRLLPLRHGKSSKFRNQFRPNALSMANTVPRNDCYISGSSEIVLCFVRVFSILLTVSYLFIS
jgi:hypothetical protein